MTAIGNTLQASKDLSENRAFTKKQADTIVNVMDSHIEAITPGELQSALDKQTATIGNMIDLKLGVAVAMLALLLPIILIVIQNVVI